MDRALASGAKGRAFESPIARHFFSKKHPSPYLSWIRCNRSGNYVLIGGRAHSVEDVEFIAQAGFPFVEISIRTVAEFHRDLDALKQIKDSYGIFYLAHGPEEDNPWNPEALRGNFLPLIKSLLGCAAELSISLFTVHFWIDRRFVDGGIVNEKLKILEDMSICAREHDITLCIENLSESFSDFSPAFTAIPNLWHDP